MSKTRLISAMAAGLAMLFAACWLVTATFPLMAAPQMVNDAPGVSVDLRGAEVMHRSAVPYPLAAVQKRIQGVLSVEVKIDDRGNVADVRVLSGPDELRRATIESVLQWHFTRSASGTTRVVQISFELPKDAEATPESGPVRAGGPGGVQSVVGGVPGGVQGGVAGGVRQGVLGGVIGGVPTTAPPPPPPPPVAGQSQSVTVIAQAPPRGVLGGIIGSVPAGPRTINSITVLGIPESARNELLASLPVHAGDTMTSETTQKLYQAVRDFDEHMSIQQIPGATPNDVAIQIVAPGATPPRVKVGGNVQAAMILKKVTPVYPELAKSARVSGVVRLAALIAKDGTIRELKVIEGPALLQQAAVDAVRQWVYQVTMLNGNPTEVETTIDVNFTLNQ